MPSKPDIVESMTPQFIRKLTGIPVIAIIPEQARPNSQATGRCMERWFADYIEDKGISLEFDTDIEEKILACDPDKIERIILNLLSNAIIL